MVKEDWRGRKSEKGMKGEVKKLIWTLLGILVKQPGIWATPPGAGQENCSWSDCTNI